VGFKKSLFSRVLKPGNNILESVEGLSEEKRKKRANELAGKMRNWLNRSKNVIFTPNAAQILKTIAKSAICLHPIQFSI